MAECSVTSVQLLNNPAAFTDPICLEVQYECLSELRDDLEWKLVYLGSTESPEADQLLDSALVGPVQPGHFKFRMEAPAPDHARIPSSDLVGLTGLFLTCSYRGKEFVRVGYYVNIEYSDPELQGQEPKPNPPIIDKLQRSIMADHPRVTKFPHDFDSEPEPMPAPEPEPADEDIMPEEDGDDEEEEEEEEEEEGDERGGMVEVDVENVDPNGHAAAAAAADASYFPGKPPAAAAAAAGAGAADMEL